MTLPVARASLRSHLGNPRLLAACAVLFLHYQHFFVPPVDYQFHVNRAAVSPLYHQLAWLFDNGHVAVQYFWAVSGFVFAHVYLADSGARGRFWLARVARLWPLHLLTLVLVAVLPLVLTSVLAEALMVWLGIGVKVATLPVIALGVGIGVDYGIYLYNRLEQYLRLGLSLQEAYLETIRCPR